MTANAEVGQKCGAHSELKNKCKLMGQFSYPQVFLFCGGLAGLSHIKYRTQFCPAYPGDDGVLCLLLNITL